MVALCAVGQGPCPYSGSPALRYLHCEVGLWYFIFFDVDVLGGHRYLFCFFIEKRRGIRFVVHCESFHCVFRILTFLFFFFRAEAI